MMNRVGSDKRILWFTEVIPDSAAFISCLEPGQEEINPHLAGLGTVWNLIGMIRLIEILPAQLALSLWCSRGPRRGNDLGKLALGLESVLALRPAFFLCRTRSSF